MDMLKKFFALVSIGLSISLAFQSGSCDFLDKRVALIESEKKDQSHECDSKSENCDKIKTRLGAPK